MSTIFAKELMARTGLTYRQIDYWCRKGIIKPVNEENIDTGVQRVFQEEDVAKISLLCVIQKSMKNISLDVLKEIYNNYDEGYIAIGPGVTLRWRLPDDHN